MSAPIDWRRWDFYKATLEACYREGFAPRGKGGGKGSALEEAGRRIRKSGRYVFARGTRNFLGQWVQTQERRARRGLDHRLPDARLYASPRAAVVSPSSRVVERHILTAAQNDTAVHAPFLENLRALAAYTGARLHVGRFTYKVDYVRDRARDAGEATRWRHKTWARELGDCLTSERLRLGDLWFCAEMNTLPTADRPLSGLLTYGQGATAIFPHAKVALETTPTAADATPPCALTTGCCTVASYSDTKAGHKGEFHHVLGAVVVEVDAEGRTFFRHVIGKGDGTLQDLDLLVSGGKVRPGERVEAITFGDLQLPFLDPDVARATWGVDAETLQPLIDAPDPLIDAPDPLIDALKPRFAFYHDTIDFKSISHHDEKKPRERFRTFLKGGHLVEGDVRAAARFLEASGREWCKTVVVESNHDRWLERWLDRCDHRADRANALAFLRWERARMEAEARGEEDFNVLRHAVLEAAEGRLGAVEFVPEGGSYVICRATGGIECGGHGHLGPNGAKPSPTALARVSGKANIADKHAPGIVDGLYVAGTSSLLRLGYNKGPSSWRHAHTVVYPTGKRALLFVDKGRWRA